MAPLLAFPTPTPTLCMGYAVVFSGGGRAVTCLPREQLVMSGDIVGCHNWGVGIPGIYRVETWDVAKHLRVHRTPPQPPTTMIQTQCHNCAKVERHWAKWYARKKRSCLSSNQGNLMKFQTYTNRELCWPLSPKDGRTWPRSRSFEGPGILRCLEAEELFYRCFMDAGRRQTPGSEAKDFLAQ